MYIYRPPVHVPGLTRVKEKNQNKRIKSSQLFKADAIISLMPQTTLVLADIILMMSPSIAVFDAQLLNSFEQDEYQNQKMFSTATSNLLATVPTLNSTTARTTTTMSTTSPTTTTTTATPSKCSARVVEKRLRYGVHNGRCYTQPTTVVHLLSNSINSNLKFLGSLQIEKFPVHPSLVF